MKNFHDTLLTDLYQLTMLQGYLDQCMEEDAMFEFFVRKLAPTRNFFMAVGIESVLTYLENLHFTDEDLKWLDSKKLFSKDFLDYLRDFRFTGSVEALPEGTIFFPQEPVIKVTASLLQAQFIESRIMNILHFQTLIASKAARIVLSAPDRTLIDFGMRRSHGAEAALFAARASYIAGMTGTATVLADQLYGVPSYGTMAHAFVQAHDDENLAFEHFARSHPDNAVMIIDTYDTENAAHKIVSLSSRLQKDGITIKGVRLDSGDLAEHAFKVRAILDAGGLRNCQIFASGNLDEFSIRDLIAQGAPIDGFGIGSRLDTSADVPYFDSAYKIQEYKGIFRRKKSEGKATLPGRKQIYRFYENNNIMTHDILTLSDDHQQGGKDLLRPFMRAGKRISEPVTLEQARKFAASECASLPEYLRKPEESTPYPVIISQKLKALTAEVDSLLLKAQKDEASTQ
jgi:nicotinate phosphoribosyltransferase